MVTFICMWMMGSWALIVLVLGWVIGMGMFVCHILWISCSCRSVCARERRYADTLHMCAEYVYIILYCCNVLHSCENYPPTAINNYTIKPSHCRIPRAYDYV